MKRVASRPRHIRRILVQAVWLALAGLVGALFVVGIPVYFRQVATPCEPSRCIYFHLSNQSAGALEEVGLSIHFYAVYMTALVVIATSVVLALAVFIFWRPTHTRMTIFFSFMLLLLGPTFFSALTEALVQAQPAWGGVIRLLQAPGLWFFVVFGYVFPDGYFTPCWTRMLAVATAAVVVGLFGSSSLPSFLTPTNWVEGALFLSFCALFAASALAQAYRYRRVSGVTERQQIKWVVFGLVAFVSLALVIVSLPFFVPALLQPGLPNAFYYLAAGTVNVSLLLGVMATIVIAILRYRLWDIDLIIRRTLQYSLLSGLLALTYFAIVVVLQNLLSAVGSQQSEFVTVASTLAIAALFFPLRNRVQDFIDRRFFRQKYDAQKVLADFAATARNETDLDKLTARLVEVVDETMQPENTSLWLKK